WGLRTLRLWLPTSDAIVRVTAETVSAVGDRPPPNELDLVFTAAAARIADALSTDALLAPVESKVIPLPHQLHALSRAMSGDRVRFLLADEVGLGKTIEAGLIMRELKLRGLVERILVVAPAGLVTQWVAEMRTHFTEEFQLVVPGEMSSLRRLHGVDEGDNLWRRWNQVVCPMDSVKPMERRKGWSFRQVQAYNRDRFVDMLAAGWDLVVIDEAHRMGGSSEQVARYKLGEALSEASPYLLLLSATPHQGKTDGFRRLMAFLDKNEFIGEDSLNREKVSPYVIRTEKRVAIDADGNPLFKPRFTQLHSIEWGDSHAEQQALYDAVTEYVREGYNQAMAEKNTAVGFLMILMQRLVTSSTRAIRVAMERRLEVLDLPKEQLALFPEDIGAEWAELDSQEQLEEVLKTRLKAMSNERQEVELLLSAARRCEARGPDVKAKGLLEKIQELQREANDPDLKVLIFTEFVPTQEMLAEFLESSVRSARRHRS
ncbi:MAG: SNF2-related protein, partial [Phycisphaerales bacterium]|nr:SNF2-related protein [Phycisphaerales bacterium]